MTKTGLHRICTEAHLHSLLRKRVGYLCHSASVDQTLRHGADLMYDLLGERLTALFAPQHGLHTDAQDNMIESAHFIHPKYNIPVFSLYSETREPTPEMLEHIDTLVIDLQDSGARVYTYIWTMILAMKACASAGIPVIILDRPNPLDGITLEGNTSTPEFASFIGLHPLPMRHGMTMGELAWYAVSFWNIPAEVYIIEVTDWDRTRDFSATELPWVLPSPNLASLNTLSVYPGMVLIEGTSLSEGRGTVRPFELFGHPALRHISWQSQLQRALDDAGCSNFRLRPHTFVPTFEKWSGTACHGYQLHVFPGNKPAPTVPETLAVSSPHDATKTCENGAWTAAQILLRELFKLMGADFAWRNPPFEYIYDRLPIDILNGTDQIRLWIESDGNMADLREIAGIGRDHFAAQRRDAIRTTPRY
jgi:uncharacterized protein YbbC (DUF1343 family)